VARVSGDPGKALFDCRTFSFENLKEQIIVMHEHSGYTITLVISGRNLKYV